MFKAIAFVVAIICGFIGGSQIGTMTESGLLGFVVGVVTYIVMQVILGVIGALIDAGISAIGQRSRDSQYSGKSKYV